MVAWLLNEPDVSTSLLESILVDDEVIVPAHWSAEVGNALLVSVRRKRLPEEKLEPILKELELLGIVAQSPVGPDRMLELVRFADKYGLTFYDAVYVHLALETKAILASLDEAMRNAATRLGLRLLPTAENK